MFEKDEAKITDKMGLILKGIRLQKGFPAKSLQNAPKLVCGTWRQSKMNSVRQVSRCSVESCGLWASPLTGWFTHDLC